jgi:hypothetical protein
MALDPFDPLDPLPGPFEPTLGLAGVFAWPELWPTEGCAGLYTCECAPMRRTTW